MTDPLQTAPPETVGMSGARLRKLDEHLRIAYVDGGRLPCALTLVARRGQVAHLGVLGSASLEDHRPAKADTVFRIYSMTKPLTSVLFMMLVEEGKIALDDPVHRHIPQWRGLQVYEGGEGGAFRTVPAARPMRIVDLMRHTAGLTYGFQERTPVDAAYRAAGIGVVNVKAVTLDQMIDRLADLPLEFSPGQHFNYSVATDVLGYIIGKIEGRPFEQVLKARLIDPLGMTDTDFQTTAANAGRLASCYVREGDGLALQDDWTTSPYRAPPHFVSGGGGLVSTAADYLRFCRMMLNRGELDGVRYLSPKTVALMTANHLPGGAELPDLTVSLFSEVSYAGVGFGLGFAVNGDPARTQLAGSAGEYAWGGAAATYFWIDPVEELIVIFMTQCLWGNYPVRSELRTLVYAALTEAND